MEPIRITDLKKIVQNVILSNQEKLNPNFDLYIDENEIKEVLKHFGEKDISALLAKPASTEEENTGLDVFEAIKKKEEVVNEEKVAEQEVENLNLEEQQEEENEVDESNFDYHNTKAEAKQNLEQMVQNGIAGYNTEEPGGLAYRALDDQRKRAIEQNADTRAIEDMQAYLKEMSKNYTRNFGATLTDGTNVSKSRKVPLKNGKELEIEQSIGFGGDTTFADKDDLEKVEVDENGNESGTDTENTTNNDLVNKIFNGGFSYGLGITSENFNTNLAIDIGSDNMDLKIGGTYVKTFSEDSQLMSTLVARETIVDNKSNGSGGVALDYKNKDITTGIYGFYEHDSSSGQQSWQVDSEAYVKYKDIVTASLNYGGMKELSYLNASIDLNGVKDIDEKNLKLSGGVTFGSSIIDFNKEIFQVENNRFYGFGTDLKGGLQLKTEDVTASLNGVASYLCTITSFTPNETKYTHKLGGAVYADCGTDKLDVSAMVSVVKEDLSNKNAPASIATNVTFCLKNLFKGISPFVSYTLDNSVLETGIPYKHSIAGGVKVSIEDLKNYR